MSCAANCARSGFVRLSSASTGNPSAVGSIRSWTSRWRATWNDSSGPLSAPLNRLSLEDRIRLTSASISKWPNGKFGLWLAVTRMVARAWMIRA